MIAVALIGLFIGILDISLRASDEQFNRYSKVITYSYHIWEVLAIGVFLLGISSSVHQRNHVITQTKVERLHSRGTTLHLSKNKNTLSFNSGEYKGHTTGKHKVYMDIVNDSYKVTKIKRVKPSKVLQLIIGTPYMSTPSKTTITYVINPQYMKVSKSQLITEMEIERDHAMYKGSYLLDKNGNKVTINEKDYK